MLTLSVRQTRLGPPIKHPSATQARIDAARLFIRPFKGARLGVRMSAVRPPDGVQNHVIMHEGKQYVPLSEVQRFFEAGIRSGAAERIEMLEEQLQKVEQERNELAAGMRQEYTVHEREMKQLLGVALALEEEVVKRAAEVDWVATQAALEMEARMGEAFSAQLEVMHKHDVEEVQEAMHERIETMGHALRTALAGKEQWRHRAVEAEKQLAQLRGQIQQKLEGAQQGVKRAQHAQKASHTVGTWKQADED